MYQCRKLLFRRPGPVSASPDGRLPLPLVGLGSDGERACGRTRSRAIGDGCERLRGAGTNVWASIWSSDGDRKSG